LTLQISHQTILQAFQQESTRKFQQCLIEVGGEIIEEFVDLRAKLYAIKKLDGEEEKNWLAKATEER